MNHVTRQRNKVKGKLTFAIFEQLSVPFAPRLKFRIRVFPLFVTLVGISLGPLEFDRVEPNAASTFVRESSFDDSFDKLDNLGDVLGHAREGRRSFDMQCRH